MYAWIWRHLPFGVAGKIGGSVVLAAAAMALMWFVVFPWADPWIEETLLPWNEGQLEGDFGPGADTVDPDNPTGPADDDADPGLVDDDDEPIPDDPHDIPYDTE